MTTSHIHTKKGEATISNPRSSVETTALVQNLSVGTAIPRTIGLIFKEVLQVIQSMRLAVLPCGVHTSLKENFTLLREACGKVTPQAACPVSGVLAWSTIVT
jgi:hypothetical protein